MDKLEKERNSDNPKMTFLVFLLIVLVIAIILFQFFIYITTKEKIECVEEKLGSISSAANSALEIAELPIRRNIDSEISVNGEIDDDSICNILKIEQEELEQIKSNPRIQDDSLCKILKIDKEELERIKSSHHIQDEKHIDESCFNVLKSYIVASSEEYANTIYEELYRITNDELYSKWYAYIFSGVIKYHLGGEITSIELSLNDYYFVCTGRIVVDNDYNITLQTLLNGGIYIHISYRRRDINIEKNFSVSSDKKSVISPEDFSVGDGAGGDSFEKPIIYIYPTQEQNISVKLGNPELLTCSYPQYEDGGWDVLAKPNGDLLDLKTGKNLYSLYWEGISNKVYDYSNTPELEGFVVKGEDTTKFLEEKLSILGLSEREKEEFIIYWLPQMEDNKYNYIRFETIEEIEKEMPLQIEPKPDTTIRVLMDWKKLDEAIEVKEQELIPVERNGYTVVEWGASILNENIVR